MFNHPEVSQYGLELDCDLWQQFNKELAVRNIMRQELPFGLDAYIEDSSEDITVDYDCYYMEISNIVETLRLKGALSYNYEVINNV